MPSLSTTSLLKLTIGFSKYQRHHSAKSKITINGTTKSQVFLKMASRNLIKTYTTINTRYYKAKKLQKTKKLQEKRAAEKVIRRFFNEKGFTLAKNPFIGKGTFCRVFLAIQKETNLPVAIKISKSSPRYRKESQKEARILRSIHHNTPSSEKHIVRFIKDFSCHSQGTHIIVLEYLKNTLYQEMLEYRKRAISFSFNEIRTITKKLLHAFSILKAKKIVHLDIKPENIMVDKENVKLIDFNSTARDGTYLNDLYKQTRYYRAPEIALQCNTLLVTQAADIWSLGCILYELHAGEPLFQTKSSVHHIFRIFKTLGMPENEFIHCIHPEFIQESFDKDATGNYTLKKKYLSYFKTIRVHKKALEIFKQKPRPGLSKEAVLFQNLLRKIFVYHPMQRPLIKAIRSHPFISFDRRRKKCALHSSPVPVAKKPKRKPQAPVSRNKKESKVKSKKQARPPLPPLLKIR